MHINNIRLYQFNIVLSGLDIVPYYRVIATEGCPLLCIREICVRPAGRRRRQCRQGLISDRRIALAGDLLRRLGRARVEQLQTRNFINADRRFHGGLLSWIDWQRWARIVSLSAG